MFWRRAHLGKGWRNIDEAFSEDVEGTKAAGHTDDRPSSEDPIGGTRAAGHTDDGPSSEDPVGGTRAAGYTDEEPSSAYAGGARAAGYADGSSASDSEGNGSTDPNGHDSSAQNFVDRDAFVEPGADDTVSLCSIEPAGRVRREQ